MPFDSFLVAMIGHCSNFGKHNESVDSAVETVYQTKGRLPNILNVGLTFKTNLADTELYIKRRDATLKRVDIPIDRMKLFQEL